MPKKDGKEPKFPPWTVEVDVHLKSDSCPPDFTIESFLKEGRGDRLVFNNAGRPGFNIVFRLHDETGKGYRFPSHQQRKDAVWSQLGANCCPTSERWEVFEPKRVFDDEMALTVYNPNPSPAQGDFTYTLRVTADGTNYLELDPGGLNQNGNFR